MLKRIILSWCCAVLTLVASLSFAAQTQPVAKTVKQAASSVQSTAQAIPQQTEFPVLFDGIKIVAISYSPVASLTPENRARIVRQNIQAFADSAAATKSLKVIMLPEELGVGNNENMLLVITGRDAEKTGMTAPELATAVLVRIQSAVDSYRTRRSWKTYGLGAALTLLTVIGLWLALHFNNKAFTVLASKLARMEKIWKQEVRFKNVRVLSAVRIEHTLLLILRLLRILIMLLCWYLFLLLTLSFFPETRKYGDKILDYLITPFSRIFHTAVSFIPNLFFIFVIGLIALYALKFISYVFRLIERGELKFDWFYDDWARPTYQIVRFLVIVTALISAYPYIPGSSSKAFQGVGLVLGAIISFASSSAISNIVAGIILTYTRAFKLYDRIKVGDTTGDVVDKTLLVTRIKTIKHVIVTIPNSLVMGSQIINYSTSAAEGQGVILHTTATIGYDVPWKEVQRLMMEAALATDRLLHDPAPFVLQTSLDDFYVSYQINAYTKEPERMADIYSDLHQNILAKFDAAGVEIMSPHYYALRDGNAAAVPSILGDQGYKPPAFEVNTRPATD